MAQESTSMSTMLHSFPFVLTPFPKILFVHGTADNVRLKIQLLYQSLTVFYTGKLREGDRGTLQWH